MGVSPSRFDLNLDEDTGTHSFRVFNYGDKPLNVNLEINNWDLDERGKVRLLPPTEQSLDRWIIINPVRFEIKPEDSQLVRFEIRPRTKLTEGEHRAMIYLNQEAGTNLQSRGSLRVQGRHGRVWHGRQDQTGR